MHAMNSLLGTRLGISEGEALLISILLLVVTVPMYGSMIYGIAMRKGKAPGLWVLIAFLPVANMFILKLVSLPDEMMERRLRYLESRVAGIQRAAAPQEPAS